MKKLIIGSVAASHWWDDFRKTGDIDIITDVDISGNMLVETHWFPLAEKIIAANKHHIFADPNILFTLKVSHAMWDIHWNKTMRDIFFMQDKGCKIIEPLCTELEKMWESIHIKKQDKSKIKLVDNEMFFTPMVKRIVPHDHIHEVVAGDNPPMHTRIRKNMNSALCDEELWNELSFEEKCKTVEEEASVIAIERFMLTQNIHAGIAFSEAIKKLVTTMTKGWFNRFIRLNYRSIKQPDKLEYWKQQLQ